MEELLSFCNQYHLDMKSKVPAKGVARKGMSVVDCKFWKTRWNYASDVNQKKLMFEKGVVDCHISDPIREIDL
ncbi:hypothetical protein YC2023_093522 [Brassica napus]